MTAAYEGDGIMVNSGPFNGMPNSTKAKDAIALHRENGLGKRTVNYRLRDWGISRQRYWGAPIPMIHCAVAASCRCRSRTCPSCCRRMWS